MAAERRHRAEQQHRRRVARAIRRQQAQAIAWELLALVQQGRLSFGTLRRGSS